MNTDQKKRERRLRRRQERSGQPIASTLPQQKQTEDKEEQLHYGLPMPKLQHLLAITKVPSNWTTLELYMVIRGKKIAKHFPEYQEMNTTGSYRNGAYLLKTEYGAIEFVTYTPFDGICAFNHYSTHSTTYGLVHGRVNLFGSEKVFGEDGADYVNENLDGLIRLAQQAIKNGLPFWDVITQSSDPSSNSDPVEYVPIDREPTATELEQEKRRKERQAAEMLPLRAKYGYIFGYE